MFETYKYVSEVTFANHLGNSPDNRFTRRELQRHSVTVEERLDSKARTEKGIFLHKSYICHSPFKWYAPTDVVVGEVSKIKHEMVVKIDNICLFSLSNVEMLLQEHLHLLEVGKPSYLRRKSSWKIMILEGTKEQFIEELSYKWKDIQRYITEKGRKLSRVQVNSYIFTT